MTDLKNEIKRELGQIEPPDLWDRIRAEAELADDTGPDLTTAPRDLAPERRLRGPWMLVAAAVIVVVGAVTLFALETDDEPDTIRTVTIPPTPVVEIRNGWVVFAADAAGGDALASPLDHYTAEVNPQPMDLYIAREGETTRRVTSTANAERCPTVSPDGKRLAYLVGPVTKPDQPSDVSLVVAGFNESGELGREELRVPLPATGQYSMGRGPNVPCPRWSPDGSRIAYAVHLPPPDYTPPGTLGWYSHRAELHVVTLEGQDRAINSGKLALDEGTFAWSPDGEAIAYPAQDGAWVAPIDGGEPSLALGTDLTPIWDLSLVGGAPPRTMATAVRWSSRGELAITVVTSTLNDARRHKDGSYSGSVDGDWVVHVVNMATKSDETIDLTEGENDRVTWSPDGSRLAAVRNDGHVVVHDRTDGSTVTVAPRKDDGSGLPVSAVTWSPDGEHLLAFASHSDQGSALVSMSPDGSSVVVLTPWSWAFEFMRIDDVSWQPTPA